MTCVSIGGGIDLIIEVESPLVPDGLQMSKADKRRFFGGSTCPSMLLVGFSKALGKRVAVVVSGGSFSRVCESISDEPGQVVVEMVVLAI